jgi:hypothetical protein
MVCTRCGIIGADARPNWREQPAGLSWHRAMAMSAEWHRALRLLAGSPLGVTEAIMLAHGFTIEMLVDLVHEGRRRRRPRPCMLASGRSRLSGCGSPMPGGWRWPDDGL